MAGVVLRIEICSIFERCVSFELGAKNLPHRQGEERPVINNIWNTR